MNSIASQTRLLILHGKHGDQYWIVENDEELHAAALEVFQYNNDNQYYCDVELENNADQTRLYEKALEGGWGCRLGAYWGGASTTNTSESRSSARIVLW